METYTFDLQRIFIGELPLVFLLEILFRTSILFLYTFVLLRIVGQRGVGQLSMTEFTVIIALGSAVGDPLFYADVPLLHGMVVIALIVLFQRVATRMTMVSQRMSVLLEGTAHRIVKDGQLDLEGLKRARLSREEVFAGLRLAKIENLGEVQCAYLEIDGKISVFKQPPEHVQAGLSLLEDTSRDP